LIKERKNNSIRVAIIIKSLKLRLVHIIDNIHNDLIIYLSNSDIEEVLKIKSLNKDNVQNFKRKYIKSRNT
jgi:hypothetical protein